jgi:GNAT superfamily N-acetyltransferase
MSIERVHDEAGLADLLPLMRAYCDFYKSNPSDEALLAMSRALIDDPEREGLQMLARDDDGRPVGFATIFWTWSTNSAARIGIMNDLFVTADARGTGAADALIRACVDRCRERGAIKLEWQTALDNHRAQAVYERVGGKREQWLDYSLPAAGEAERPTAGKADGAG